MKKTRNNKIRKTRKDAKKIRNKNLVAKRKKGWTFPELAKYYKISHITARTIFNRFKDEF